MLISGSGDSTSLERILVIKHIDEVLVGGGGGDVKRELIHLLLQVFYTFAFVAHAVACIGLISIYVCASEASEKKVVRYGNLLLAFACLCSTISE